jgi:cytochrome c-type biogenesis protein
MVKLSALIAFGAGLLSFVSPCIIPLIPSWLFFIGGTGLEAGRNRVFLRTFFFVLGFSAVFISSSVVFSALVIVSGIRYMDIAAGIIIIIFGLNVLFDFLKFLNFEKRFRFDSRAGNGGAFLIGAAFGAGWTPCVGPILASILLLAGQSGRLHLAVLYLGLYSAGLGLPFLGAALFFDRFLKSAEKLKKHAPLIRKASAVLLIVTGILILSGRFQAVNRLLQSISLRWGFI